VHAVAVVEIVAGVAGLVVGGTAATLVLALLYGAFAVIGALLLRSGAAVSCGCFGQRSSAMTPIHVGVNAAAAVVAAVAAGVGAPGLYSGTADRSLGVLAVATVAAVVLAAAIVALLTVVPDRVGAAAPLVAPAFVARDATGADPGPTAGLVPSASPGEGRGVDTLHALDGVTPAGDPARSELAGTGRVSLLAVLTPGCTTCSHFWSVFGDLPADGLPGRQTDLVIVTRGDEHENPNRVRDLAPAEHPVVRSTAAWQDYGVVAGPYFVLLDGRHDLVLGEGTATTWADVAGLVRQAVGSASPRRRGGILDPPGRVSLLGATDPRGAGPGA
jgi:hypothetical protein